MNMKKMNIRPLGENVLVSSDKPEKKTESGIFLPENASEDRSSKQGRVVAVGESDKIKVKSGQRVIYTRYGGTEVKVSGIEYSLVKNEDILAIIEE